MTTALLAFTLLAAPASPTPLRPDPPHACDSCKEWNEPRAPFRVFGNTYYVGVAGLSAILITSDDGLVLLDGGLPQSAPLVDANIRALGFETGNVKLIVNSHAHYDHAGGIAAIQRASRARVAATASSAAVLRRGTPGPDDPQHAIALPFPALTEVHVIADGDTLRVGPLRLTARLTAGHTPGGTTWSWRACEARACADVVYADSQTPISANGFRFTGSTTYPAAVADFRRGHAVIEGLACDVLLTPHPAASQLWQRLEARERGQLNALRDPDACRRYAATAREQLARRLATEAAK